MGCLLLVGQGRGKQNKLSSYPKHYDKKKVFPKVRRDFDEAGHFR